MRSKSFLFLLSCLLLVSLIRCDDDSSDKKLKLDPLSSSWAKIEWRTADNGAYAGFTYSGLEPSCSNAPGTTSSEYFFFARGGDSENLVIFFEGGGACWHNNNCINNSSLYTREISDTVEDLDASTGNTGGTQAGIIDYTNESNPFKDWDIVYIPYCTGDLGWGAGDTTYTGGTIRHRGHVNFHLVLEWVKNHFNSPEKIMVCGVSAGSFNAAFNFPFIKDSYPDTEMYLIGDSGIGVMSDDFNSGDFGAASWDIQIPTRDTLPAGSTFDDFEGLSISDITMTAIYTAIANHYTDAVIAEYTTKYDSTMTMFYNMMLNIDAGPATWVAISTGTVWCDWVDQMQTILGDEAAGITAGNFHYYIAPGSVHTILTRDSLYTVTSDSTPVIDWIRAMVEGTAGFTNVECTDDCSTPTSFPTCE